MSNTKNYKWLQVIRNTNIFSALYVILLQVIKKWHKMTEAHICIKGHIYEFCKKRTLKVHHMYKGSLWIYKVQCVVNYSVMGHIKWPLTAKKYHLCVKGHIYELGIYIQWPLRWVNNRKQKAEFSEELSSPKIMCILGPH